MPSPISFGCGNGGFVRYAAADVDAEVVAFEDGWISDAVAEQGIELLDRGVLEKEKGTRGSRLERLLSWAAISRVVDPRFGVTAHPVGWTR